MRDYPCAPCVPRAVTDQDQNAHAAPETTPTKAGTWLGGTFATRRSVGSAQRSHMTAVRSWSRCPGRASYLVKAAPGDLTVAVIVMFATS
jgi:hypothetical protein